MSVSHFVYLAIWIHKCLEVSKALMVISGLQRLGNYLPFLLTFSHIA